MHCFKKTIQRKTNVQWDCDKKEHNLEIWMNLMNNQWVKQLRKIIKNDVVK